MSNIDEPVPSPILMPLEAYRQDVQAGLLESDNQQRFVMERINLLAQRLTREPAQEPSSFFHALFGWGREKMAIEPQKGLYIYGSVGRGKSMLVQYLVDAFAQSIWRLHFHEFMQLVQKELKPLNEAKEKDPLKRLATKLAERAPVFVLDEMQIENIADAMIVGRLFQGLFENGVILVTTSNRHPRALYQNGLNRNRFLPFIDLISEHCEIIDLSGKKDYREGQTEISGGYFIHPQRVDERFNSLAEEAQPKTLKIGARQWSIERTKGRAVLLSFAQICETHRGAADYHALVQNFDALYVQNIPLLNAEKSPAIFRFITLIDMVYEARIALYVDSQFPLEDLHNDEMSAFQFERCRSRLYELTGGGKAKEA